MRRGISPEALKKESSGMYDLSPKVVDFEKNPAMYDYKDVYWVKVKFTDPDTGKDLIGDFKISNMV